MPPEKESSDVLIPPVVEPAHVVVAPSRRTASDYVALAVATCGVGLIPIAPGTWGSGVGVLVYLAVRWGFSQFNHWLSSSQRSPLESELSFSGAFPTALILAIFVVSIIGTLAATRAEKLLGKKDPGAVVIDEVAGQLVTFLFVPLYAPRVALLVGFVAFRLFDIWKPYPIRRLENLGGGLGIMADDLLAGFYAAAVMSLLVTIYFLH
jgi:phosphatidylglycerophosphatase A